MKSYPQTANLPTKPCSFKIDPIILGPKTELCCKMCPFVGRSKIDLQFHHAVKHTARRFNCPSCKFSSVSKEECKEHVLEAKHSNLSKIQLRCQFCSFICLTQRALTVHESRCKFNSRIIQNALTEASTKSRCPADEPVTTITCQLCDFITKKETDLKLHAARLHVGREKEACEQPQFLQNPDDILALVNLHGDAQAAPDAEEDLEILYSCQECGYLTRSGQEWAVHQVREHGAQFDPDAFDFDALVPSTDSFKSTIVPAMHQAGVTDVLQPIQPAIEIPDTAVDDSNDDADSNLNENEYVEDAIYVTIDKIDGEVASELPLIMCSKCGFIASTSDALTEHECRVRSAVTPASTSSDITPHASYHNNTTSIQPRLPPPVLITPAPYTPKSSVQKLSRRRPRSSIGKPRPVKKPKNCVCSVCGQAFTDQTRLLSHRAEKHSRAGVAFHCELCSFSAKLEEQLKNHYLVQHEHVATVVPKGAPEVKCEYCNYSTRKRIDLIGHMFDRHRSPQKYVRFKGKVYCLLCSFICDYVSEFEKHFKAEHTTKIKATIEKHNERRVLLHESEETAEIEVTTLKAQPILSCQACDFETSSKTDLENHLMQRHPENVIFKCAACGFEGPSRAELILHVSQVHNPSAKT